MLFWLKLRIEVLFCIAFTLLLLGLSIKVDYNNEKKYEFSISQENVPGGVTLLITSAIFYFAGQATGSKFGSIEGIIYTALSGKLSKLPIDDISVGDKSVGDKSVESEKPTK